MYFRWLCVCSVKQQACFTFLHNLSDQAAYCYSSLFLYTFPSSYVKVKTLYRFLNPWSSSWSTLLPPILLVSSYLASWQGLRWSWSLPPFWALSPPCPCKAATVPHFLIEGCSEVQECRGAQCASVFGLTQKCFSWLNSLVLRSSYNKLKGPNCPQGRGLATIDMWWDKSPVLIPQHPLPSPDRRDVHVSSVCVALWVKRPQVQDSIYTVRCGIQLNYTLECLQMTSDRVDPFSLHILLKAKRSEPMCTSDNLNHQTIFYIWQREIEIEIGNRVTTWIQGGEWIITAV